MPVLGTPTLLLLVGICLAAGLILLMQGLRTRSRGQDPHCAQCGYNLIGITSEICPECGMYLTLHTTVCGEHYRRPSLAVAGLMLLLLGLASCIPISKTVSHRQNRQRPINIVQNVKLAISDLTTVFKTGHTARPRPPGGRGDEGETVFRFQLQIGDQLPSLIRRRETNTTVRTAALTELAAVDQLLQAQIYPAYEAALKSEAPEDAKALVPLMDQLDKHMDKLLQILNGY